MKQNELNNRFAATQKIIHEDLHMENLICLWVPHNLAEHQNAERVKISNETLKFLNDGGHSYYF